MSKMTVITILLILIMPSHEEYCEGIFQILRDSINEKDEKEHSTTNNENVYPSNRALKEIVFTGATSQQRICDYVDFEVQHASVLLNDFESSKSVKYNNANYLYHGIATVWSFGDRKSFMYININKNEHFYCYLLWLEKNSQKGIDVQDVWKVKKNIEVFIRDPPLHSRGFIGNLSGHFKSDCLKQKKFEQNYTKCKISNMNRQTRLEI